MADMSRKREMSPRLNRTGWCFVIPSVILIILFVFYPMVQALITSFQTGAGNNLTFAGIANYKRLLTDTTFRKALFNTLLYLIIQVPIMILLALVISSMLNNKKLKFKGFFRTAIFLPCVTSLVAYSIVFKSLFATDGFVNSILMKLNLIAEPISWITDPVWAKILIILAITGDGLVTIWCSISQACRESMTQSTKRQISTARERLKSSKALRCPC